MTTLLKTICVAAGVSMAALTAAGAASSAQAQQPLARIQVGDLNLSAPQGRAAFDSRVNRTARRLCEDQVDLGSTMACERAVREEATEKLDQLARRDGGVNLASARR